MVFYLVKNNILINLQGIYNIILVRNIEMSLKLPQNPSLAPPKHQECTLKYHICIPSIPLNNIQSISSLYFLISGLRNLILAVFSF